MSSIYKIFLLGIGPVGDGARYGVVDRGGDGFVIRVFEAKQFGILGSSFYAA